MAIFELGTLDKLATALNALPLWIFAAVAASGWAILLLPPVGSVDMLTVRNQWGVSATLAAVIGTIFSAAKCVSDVWLLYRRRIKARRNRNRSQAITRLTEVYAPLNALVASVFTMESTVELAAYFRQRLRNAQCELRRRPSLSSPIRRALIALSDRKIEHSPPEVEYGGRWPSEAINNIVSKRREQCDLRLVELCESATRTRYEERLSPSSLSLEDALLAAHIRAEYKRLRRVIERL